MNRMTPPPRLRGAVALRGMALALGVVIMLGLVWRGSPAALLMLLPLLGLAWPDAQAPAATTADATALSQASGAERLLRPLLPLWSGQIDTLQVQQQASLDRLLASFAQIVALRDQLAEHLQGAAAPDLTQTRALVDAMAEPCDAALHGLQFGDRVHQMLDVVKTDQRRLEASLAALAHMDDAAVQRWLDELRQHYTTEEQHATHRGDAPATGRASVDFF